MTSIKRDIVAQIQSESWLAFLTHCFARTLNLLENDMAKEQRMLRSTIDATSELSKLTKKSSKIEGTFQKIRDEVSLQCPNFKVLYPTSSTVYLQIIEKMFGTAIKSLWTISLEKKLDPEMKGVIIGSQAQMVKFEYLSDINILQVLYRYSDNLSKTLQSPKITASNGQKLSNPTLKTLISLRSETLFNNLWKILKKEANTSGIEEP